MQSKTSTSTLHPVRLAAAWVAAGAVGVAAAVSATPAAAQDATGLYVGGSLGASSWKGGAAGGIADDDSDRGGKLYGGYAVTPNFAVETGYARLGRFSGPNGNLKGDGYFVDAVGTLPLGDGFSALGRVGAFNGKLRSDTAGAVASDRDTNLKLGLGVQYDLTPNMAIRTEWERYRYDAVGLKDNADLYSIGFQYRF